MVYCYKVIDLDDNDGVASVDLPGYKEMTWIPDLLPRPSATVPPPTEAFISFLRNTEAPLIVQFEEFACIIILVLQDICTEHWQSRVRT